MMKREEPRTYEALKKTIEAGIDYFKKKVGDEFFLYLKENGNKIADDRLDVIIDGRIITRAMLEIRDKGKSRVTKTAMDGLLEFKNVHYNSFDVPILKSEIPTAAKIMHELGHLYLEEDDLEEEAGNLDYWGYA